MTENLQEPPLLDEEMLSQVVELEAVRPGLLAHAIDLLAKETERFRVEIPNALLQGDVDAVRSRAHAMKGAMAGLGAARASSAAHALETAARASQATFELQALFESAVNEAELSLQALRKRI